jgi:hypothetical protein
MSVHQKQKVGHSGGFQKRKSEKSLQRNNFSDLVFNLALFPLVAGSCDLNKFV